MLIAMNMVLIFDFLIPIAEILAFSFQVNLIICFTPAIVDRFIDPFIYLFLLYHQHSLSIEFWPPKTFALP